MSNKIEALTLRVQELEKKLQDVDIPEIEEGDPEEKYETWAVWDGVSNKYQLGAVVEHNGVIYESTFNGQNVWEPGTTGTEALWKVKE